MGGVRRLYGALETHVDGHDPTPRGNGRSVTIYGAVYQPSMAQISLSLSLRLDGPDTHPRPATPTDEIDRDESTAFRALSAADRPLAADDPGRVTPTNPPGTLARDEPPTEGRSSTPSSDWRPELPVLTRPTPPTVVGPPAHTKDSFGAPIPPSGDVRYHPAPERAIDARQFPPRYE